MYVYIDSPGGTLDGVYNLQVNTKVMEIKIQGVQDKLFFFTISFNPSLVYILAIFCTTNTSPVLTGGR